MTRKTIRIVLVVILFIACSLSSFSQKLKSNEYSCSLKDVTQETLRTCSEANLVYKGTIIVKSKDNLQGSYPFYFSGMGNFTKLLTVKNSNNEPLTPTLQFDDLKREFYFNKGKPDEQKHFVTDEKTDNEVILEGMMFWLKMKKEQKE